MKLHLRHGQQHLDLELPAAASSDAGDELQARIGERTLTVSKRGSSAVPSLMVEGRAYRVRTAIVGDRIYVSVGPHSFQFTRESRAQSAHALAQSISPEVVAPMPGKVTQVAVREGQEVALGDTLVLLEAMKMENRLVAEGAGTVTKVTVSAGDMVDGGQVLLRIDYAEAT